jgi:hypothetical protein
MPIMVGTITVMLQPYRSVAAITASGSKRGTVTSLPSIMGTPRMLNIEAAWNMGVWRRATESTPMWNRMRQWYTLSSSARWSSNTPLGRPVVPPVYISTAGSVSSPSSGMAGSAAARSSS